MNCTHDYGKITGVIFVPTYAELLSEKIRAHLLRKFWKSIGVEMEIKEGLSFYNKGFVFHKPYVCDCGKIDSKCSCDFYDEELD